MRHHTILAIPEDIEDLHPEGSGAITFPRGRMRLEGLRTPDPLPALDARGPYEMRLTVAGGEIAFSVNGLEGFRRRDEHRPPGGKIGFRRTAPLIGEYADLRVTSP
ncbi:DUF1961 family protein [Streptosporangium sp. NPDC048865]|uniref:DUF1961 family protein n=1 Tax=Streptosporangium sp. NPDC048865 TaxID=3155766 RepID=UPI0034244DDF